MSEMKNMSVIQLFLNSFQNNPSFIRSIRSRMRGIRTFILPVVYTVLLSGILYISLVSYNSYQSNLSFPDLGRKIFVILSIIQVVILTLICPTLTAGIITSEKEKQTYDMLVTTPLHPRWIIRGELFSAVFFSIIIIISSIPLIGICAILGGISPREVILVYCNFILLSILLTSYGLLVSTGQKKTSTAMGAAVGSMVILVFPTISVLVEILSRRNSQTNIWAVLSPIYTIAEILTQKQVSNISMGFLKIPYWFLSFLVIGLISGLFLSISSRKFYSSRNRAMSPLQYSISYILIVGFLFLTLWNTPQGTFIWYLSTISSILLVLGVFNFVPEHPRTEDYLIVPEDLVNRRIEKKQYQLYLIPCMTILTWMAGILYFIGKGSIEYIYQWSTGYLVYASVLIFSIAFSQFLYTFVISRRNIIAMVGITILLITIIFPIIGLAIVSSSNTSSFWVYPMVILSPSFAVLSILEGGSTSVKHIVEITGGNQSSPYWLKETILYLFLSLFFIAGILKKIHSREKSPSRDAITG